MSKIINYHILPEPAKRKARPLRFFVDRFFLNNFSE
jgi:hypothetical protein